MAWRAGALALALSALAATLACAEPSRFVDYLYVDANEGGSSGGHAALGVDGQVFHYEYLPPGILVPRRDSFDHFRRQYAILENRTIEIIRIPVDERHHARMVEQLSRDHLIRSQQLAILDQARADRRALEELQAGAVEVEGLGFFGSARVAPDTEPEPALVALRRQVEEQYGPDFLDAQLERRGRQLLELTPRDDDAEVPAFAEDRLPSPTYTFPQRYRDTLAILAALEVLRDATRLSEASTMSIRDPSLELQPVERAVIEHLERGLASSLVRLLRSERPDLGFPVLLGMARLATLDRVLREDRWIFLDAFPPDATVIGADRLAGRSEALAALTDESRDELDAARSRLISSAADTGFPELAYSRLEDAGNRFVEARRALVEHGSLRISATRALPDRSAPHPAPLPSADASGASVRAGLDQAAARERAALAELQRLYDYNLFSRNCVTELFREMDRAGFDRVAKASDPPDFIPFMSALTMERAAPNAVSVRIPSVRQTALQRLYQRANPLAVYARESNTVTSTLYHRNPNDSIFLFFTDDVVVTRPLFGAVNLLVGLGASAAGLALLPFDGGATAFAGLKGAMFSLPELFFQNIRKGSYELAPPP